MKMNWMKKTGRTLLAAALLAGMTSFAMPTADAAKNIKDLSTPEEITAELQKEGGAVYPIGEPNTGYAKYFTGRSFLYPMESKFVNVANVTFEPGCINFWHKHHGSCQVLAGVSGKGYYQIWGEEPKELLPGQSVTIPEGVKHWHGAQNGSSKRAQGSPPIHQRTADSRLQKRYLPDGRRRSHGGDGGYAPVCQGLSRLLPDQARLPSPLLRLDHRGNAQFAAGLHGYAATHLCE